MNASIHPAELTVGHLGAVVYWHTGDTIHQGVLVHVEHGFDLVGPDGIEMREFVPTKGTLFTISGCEPILVTVHNVDARLKILKEAGA